MALITSVESRYEDLFHVHKKKTFWNVIHEELLSQGLNFPPKTCQKKWENLVRTYKSSKDLKTKTGRGPTKFMFFNRMDEILGDTPTNSSPHSIDVCNISQVESTHQDSNSNVIEECTPSIGKRKRQTATMQYITMKKRYFEAKEKENAEKSERKMSYLEEMVTLKKVRNELTRKKLELEERKVVALERLAFTTATD
ncbi:uncharacterized protein LOC108913573 [Anoplophora glabripennis]|uniref:uncharacterized protein LOC108913573 n=1 Tax=Anoplophora glabripennis TaxID=217634 RepID=UPI0008743F0D|nr:uncharacterized protein LOC108913573 [Anoplophora glabripennis]